ncbi:hypothetical protein E2C01_100033 [Portunus trituberculatus]|uniref:Uncharacterized protein n=1 Tax=Portunus trituberculatus TaxID=210409 RepID=A0A5B7K1X5_PORTR|nr:hypothetical protein [Portunus trituberculatus]
MTCIVTCGKHGGLDVGWRSLEGSGNGREMAAAVASTTRADLGSHVETRRPRCVARGSPSLVSPRRPPPSYLLLPSHARAPVDYGAVPFPPRTLTRDR